MYFKKQTINKRGNSGYFFYNSDNESEYESQEFTPPGPVVCFDESQSGVQRPLPFTSEAECFKLFLTEEMVGDIVETNRYALELQEKREPGVGGTTTISEMYSC